MEITRILALVLVSLEATQSFPTCICVTWSLSLQCLGGDRALSSTDVRLTYNYTEFGVSRITSGPTFKKNNGTTMRYDLEYPGTGCQSEASQSQKAEYYFEQLEHGGGGCNCVDIIFDCENNVTNRLEICDFSFYYYTKDLFF